MNAVFASSGATNPSGAQSSNALETPGAEDLTEFDTEGYSALEKIYLFSRSRVSVHRVFIAKSLGQFLQAGSTNDTISPDEAVQYVLPLLIGLAMDDDEAVKEALAAELVPIIWWFITRCKLVDEDVALEDYIGQDMEDEQSFPVEPALISVQSFTPILGTLLLSPNAHIGGPARYAVVELLRRVRKADDYEHHTTTQLPADPAIHPYDEEEDASRYVDLGLFTEEQRRLFEREMIYQVVIGMGRLDSAEDQIESDLPGSGASTATVQRTNVGSGDSYFPPSPAPSPSSTNSTGSTPSLVSTTSVSTPSSSGSSLGSTPDSVVPLLPAFSPSPSPLSTVSNADSEGTGGPNVTPSSIGPPTSPFQNTAGAWIMPRSPGDLATGADEEQQKFGGWLGSAGAHTNWVNDTSEEADLGEEAAVGRLSSMSLMAAVTASVTMSEEHQAAFVSEVGRVGRDPICWVRREASFVVGALAKVVPTKIVISSLLPLFEAMCHDSTWQVRHSALFALPAILSRLPSLERRRLALEVILPLSKDPSSTVRSGVLEALAEVMHTFHDDAAGPPEELTRLFLGIREGETRRRLRVLQKDATPKPTMSWSEFMAMAKSNMSPDDEYDIYDDVSRPLVCAFNFPAVALTLGRRRWTELRELYLELSLDSSLKVRKTLSASLGEMAKIVGPEHAKRDLMGVWWGSVRADESEVRLKAIEGMAVFIGAIGAEERKSVVGGLAGEVWSAKLKGWREREGVIVAVGEVLGCEGLEEVAVRKLVMMGLKDPVAAVREETVGLVSLVTKLVKKWPSDSPAARQLVGDIGEMASSRSYRERMTYIACQQELFSVGLYAAILILEDFWRSLRALVQDAVVDVRIKVARFLGIIFDSLSGTFDHLKAQLLEIVKLLSDDASSEVKAFCQPLLTALLASSNSRREKQTNKADKSALNFSRPPPTSSPPD
ncbi:armadillo-type protein [Cristinia sonorae]|uniref:Armadillo-type protein n=1 Tax=Cristinia sonorae TaxID=1940300 RepID=A0A8K0UXU1_9AGAR|nr:armadillo-type protein [Cristinia sonorae]